MSTITEALNQIVELTRQNLNILDSINSAFYTNKSHISTEINGEKVAIPSFISLESKIDTLRQDLDNVLNAPVTGEAYTYFDGTTQKIELSGFATTPMHVDLKSVKSFGVETNNIFKDFMSPNPYIRLDLNSIPNNITHISIKKVTIINNELRDKISNLEVVNYANLSKLLYVYKYGEDYVEYDTIKRLPLKDNSSFGNYTIKAILDNIVDENFDEHYELELNEPLTYFIKNGTIERPLKVGDTFVTNNSKVKMEIESMNEGLKTVTVRILYGAYADLCDETSNNPDLYRLRYFKGSDLVLNKFVDVSLEEDRYLCVFAAPINSSNQVAPFGEGLFLDVDSLTYVNEQGEIKNFREYYNEYVNNVGDALFSITKMMDDDEQVERLTPSEFKALVDSKPEVSPMVTTVTQINKHLNDSEDVKNIRKLYDQKTTFKSELSTVQASIDNINKLLSEISFDDTTNSRDLYMSQLRELNSQRHEIQQAINNLVQEIAQAANQSETPIENAKYRIRGFIPVSENVIRIDVEYRYKNKNKFVGNAETIGQDYIFSDWNKMDSLYRLRQPIYKDNIYQYVYPENNENKNEISFNQIDIPITQGEIVDIRYRFQFKHGYPFVETFSKWSDINTVEFPAEYIKHVDILDIITENNDEVKKNQFNNMLENKGIIKHVEDMIQDQTLTYFHKPENISSGFYTAERRVIPLSEKLRDFSELITDLQSEVYGGNEDNIVITVSDDKNSMTLRPNIVNTFHNCDYDSNESKSEILGMNMAYSQLNLTIHNTGTYNMKLHSILPGDNRMPLDVESGLNKIENYAFEDGEVLGENTYGDKRGVWMQLDETIEGSNMCPQVFNQFMYFRVYDSVFSNTIKLYDENAKDVVYENKFNKAKLPVSLLNSTFKAITPFREGTSTTTDSVEQGAKRYASIFPYLGRLSDITCLPEQTYIIVKPGESVNIPLSFYYYVGSEQKNVPKVSRAIEFDIRPSLFRDPITYKLIVEANYVDLKAFKEKRASDTISGMDFGKPNKKYTTTVSTTLGSNNKKI